MKTNDIFLPVYAGLMVFLLIVVMLIFDDQTPKIFIFILILAYTTFIAFHIWSRRAIKEGTKFPTLKQFQNIDHRPAKIANFQKVSESILRDIRASRSQENNQFAIRSSYPSQYSNVKSLDQLNQAHQEPDKYVNMFNHYSSVVWREHFRQALHFFSENLAETNDFSTGSNTYQSLLTKQLFDLKNLKEAEDICRQFLLDRAKKHFSQLQPLLDEANNLLTKNFGMTFAKMESNKTNQVGMEEFRSILKSYFQNFLLPQRFNARQSSALLQKDMFRLGGILNQMNSLIVFPHGSFAPLLLIQIVQKQFKGLSFQVNTREDRNSLKLYLQFDFAMSWNFAPQYRSYNCSKILMVLLTYLAKQNKLQNRIIRTFHSFQS